MTSLREDLDEALTRLNQLESTQNPNLLSSLRGDFDDSLQRLSRLEVFTSTDLQGALNGALNRLDQLEATQNPNLFNNLRGDLDKSLERLNRLEGAAKSSLQSDLDGVLTRLMQVEASLVRRGGLKVKFTEDPPAEESRFANTQALTRSLYTSAAGTASTAAGSTPDLTDADEVKFLKDWVKKEEQRQFEATRENASERPQVVRTDASEPGDEASGQTAGLCAALYGKALQAEAEPATKQKGVAALMKGLRSGEVNKIVDDMPGEQAKVETKKASAEESQAFLRARALQSTLEEEEAPAPFKKGDTVKIMKESRMKGKLAIVKDPCWHHDLIKVKEPCWHHDLIKVEMEEDDPKGRIKTFAQEELELVQANDPEMDNNDLASAIVRHVCKFAARNPRPP